jgi:hypothetical protein
MPPTSRPLQLKLERLRGQREGKLNSSILDKEEREKDGGGDE